MRRVISAGAAIALGACGAGSNSKSADAPVRTIEIEMRDISFSPPAVSVTKGEQVRFVFTNTGKLQHDAFIGDEAQQEEHEDEMGGMHHDSADDGVTVQPGESAEIETSFSARGTQIIGCHAPGHYAEDMKVIVSVE